MKKVIKEIYYIDDDDLDVIAWWLKDHNFNQYALAKELGVSKTYISMILNGQRPITKKLYDKFLKIGIKLGVK